MHPFYYIALAAILITIQSHLVVSHWLIACHNSNMPLLNRIEAVTIHSTQYWPLGKWIPTRFEVNSWVTLNPDTTTEWGRDSQRYSSDSQQYLWKAQVLRFEFGAEENVISRVQVRHAYELWQLSLDPNQPHSHLPCNCKFLLMHDCAICLSLFSCPFTIPSCMLQLASSASYLVPHALL